MNDEERKLLIKDLCGREPYHPRISIFNQGYEGFKDGEFDTDLWLNHIDAFRFDRIEILPYLRPMNTMTDKEYAEFLDTQHWECGDGNQPKYEYTYKTFDWLNEHHFDYRGLIIRELALEAPEGMYKHE